MLLTGLTKYYLPTNQCLCKLLLTLVAFEHAGVPANDVPVHIYVCDTKYVGWPSGAAQISLTLAERAFRYKDYVFV
jgi:hypothetical protein